MATDCHSLHLGTELLSVSAAWRSHREALADWAEHHVVQWKRYGRYRGESERIPGQRPATTAFGRADVPKLRRHFSGEDGHIIGVHAISPANRCRWIAVDIDNHGGDGSVSLANEVAAVAWWSDLRDFECSPLLVESSPGSFHLRLRFDREISSEAAYAVALWLVRNWESHGLTRRPETFPKQPRLTPRVKYGSWLRLPGKHHSREFWSRVWDGEHWLDGEAAIAEILRVTGSAPSLLPAEAFAYKLPKPVRAERAAPARPEPLIFDGDADAGLAALPDDVRRHVQAVLRWMRPGSRNAATFQLYCRMLGTQLGSRLSEHREMFEVFFRLAVQEKKQRTVNFHECWDDYCRAARSAVYAWGSDSGPGPLDRALEAAKRRPRQELPYIPYAKEPTRRLAVVCRELAGPDGDREFALPQAWLTSRLGVSQQAISGQVSSLQKHRFIQCTRQAVPPTEQHPGEYALYRLLHTGDTGKSILNN